MKLTSVGPGEVTVTARYGNYEAHKDVIVSGIVLNASETSMQARFCWRPAPGSF